MKWISHLAIGWAVSAVFNPPLVPVCLLGSTAPDWLEWVARALNRKVKHRTVTHYVSVWGFGAICGQFIWDFHSIIFWFCVGGLLHVLADSLTVSGVPLGPWSDRRFHLFGGRIRTGQPEEYMVVGVVVLLSVVVGWQFKAESSFTPFFINGGRFIRMGLLMGMSGNKIGFGFCR